MQRSNVCDNTENKPAGVTAADKGLVSSVQERLGRVDRLVSSIGDSLGKLQDKINFQVKKRLLFDMRAVGLMCVIHYVHCTRKSGFPEYF